MHICIYTHTYIYLHACICIYTPTYIHIRTYTFIHIYMYIYTHTRTYIHIHTYTHAPIPTYMHMYRHPYRHMHACMNMCIYMVACGMLHSGLNPADCHQADHKSATWNTDGIPRDNPAAKMTDPAGSAHTGIALVDAGMSRSVIPLHPRAQRRLCTGHGRVKFVTSAPYL